MAHDGWTTWRFKERQGAETLYLGLLARDVSGTQQQELDVISPDHSTFENYCNACQCVSSSPTRCEHTAKLTYFLDNFAELFACKKLPSIASCATLANSFNWTTIFLTRNEDFHEADRNFISFLGARMQDLSKRWSN
jgi:hypothetical protein